jgi:hypothetical protein
MENLLWNQAFGANLANIDAGNGAFNHIDGNLTAVANQDVHSSGLFGGTNTGFNSANIDAGNGAFNHIDGNLTAVANQHVG